MKNHKKLNEMKLKLTLFFILTVFTIKAQFVDFHRDSVMLRNIYIQALTEGKAYNWLHHICYNVGARLSGSYGEKK